MLIYLKNCVLPSSYQKSLKSTARLINDILVLTSKNECSFSEFEGNDPEVVQVNIQFSIEIRADKKHTETKFTGDQICSEPIPNRYG